MPKIPLGPQTVESAGAMTNMMHAITAMRQQETTQRRMEFEMRMAKSESIARRQLQQERLKMEKEQHELSLYTRALGALEAEFKLKALPEEQEAKRRERDIANRLREKQITRTEADIERAQVEAGRAEIARQREEGELAALPAPETRKRAAEAQDRYTAASLEEQRREIVARSAALDELDRMTGRPERDELLRRGLTLEKAKLEHDIEAAKRRPPVKARELEAQEVETKLKEAGVRQAQLEMQEQYLQEARSSGEPLGFVVSRIKTDLIAGKIPNTQDMKLARLNVAEKIYAAALAEDSTAEISITPRGYGYPAGYEPRTIEINRDTITQAYREMATLSPESIEFAALDAMRTRTFKVNNSNRYNRIDRENRSFWHLMAGGILHPNDTRTQGISRVISRSTDLMGDMPEGDEGRKLLTTLVGDGNRLRTEYDEIMEQAAGPSGGISVSAALRGSRGLEVTAGKRPNLGLMLSSWQDRTRAYHEKAADTIYIKLGYPLLGGKTTLGGNQEAHQDWTLNRFARPGKTETELLPEMPEATGVMMGARGIARELTAPGMEAPTTVITGAYSPVSDLALQQEEEGYAWPAPDEHATPVTAAYFDVGKKFMGEYVKVRDVRGGDTPYGVHSIAQLDEVAVASPEDFEEALELIDNDSAREQMRLFYRALRVKHPDGIVPRGSPESLALIGMLADARHFIERTTAISPGPDIWKATRFTTQVVPTLAVRSMRMKFLGERELPRDIYAEGWKW